jgi:CXXX repeat modification system protein
LNQLPTASTGAPSLAADGRTLSSLLILLDSDAPSFCYYPTARRDDRRVMNGATLAEVLGFVSRHQLTPHLLCGPEGIPPDLLPLLDTVGGLAYVAPGRSCQSPNDIVVVESGHPDQIGLIEPANFSIAILRVGMEDVPTLPELWSQLSERVARVVVVTLELERYGRPDLERYRQVLELLATKVEARFLAGWPTEVNVLTDRILLSGPRHCGAGVDHLTVDPDGMLFVCPGYACDSATAVGSIRDISEVPNAQLLTLDRAPICQRCDAFQCRRCVFLNQKTTLEVNTPPWQVCEASHVEREVSRQLLERLHRHGIMTQFRRIPTISYSDPLELLLDQDLERGRPPDTQFAVEIAVRNSGRSNTSVRKTAPLHDKEAPMDRKPVGQVTAEERDQIRDLHLRRSGLSELFASLAGGDGEALQGPLYDRLVHDMGAATLAFQGWWDATARRYGWERVEGHSWQIDFETRDVFLV